MLFPVCDFITKQEGIITFNNRAEINYFYPGFFFSISCMKFYIWINYFLIKTIYHPHFLGGCVQNNET